MSEYNVQKLAFTSLSRENWKMIKWLNEKDTYLVIQGVADYILNGERPNLEGMAGLAAEQIIATIDRKGEKTINSVNNLNKNKNSAVPEQVIPQEVVEVEPPKIITEQTENISVEPRLLKECVDELMNIYHTKNYESMIYAINHKCRKWGHTFEELKAKCDTRIELGET